MINWYGFSDTEEVRCGTGVSETTVYLAGDETQNKHNPSDQLSSLAEASVVFEGS